MLKRVTGKKTIKMQDWMNLHLYSNTSYIDQEYLDVANEIYSTLRALCPAEYKNDLIKDIALMSTAYLEDVVSDFGIWNSFGELNQKKYGRRLPFFDVDEGDYLKDNINLVDVKFIVWYVTQQAHSMQTEDLMNPWGLNINAIAIDIYTIFVDKFEDLPINDCWAYLRDESKKYHQWYPFREMCKAFFYSNYLFIYQSRRAKSELSKSINKGANHRLEYLLVEATTFNVKVGPVDEYVYQWLAKMFDDKKLSSALENMQSRFSNYFQIVDKTEDGYLFIDRDDDSEYMVAQESIILKKWSADEYYFTHLVLFDGKWYLNGALGNSTGKNIEQDIEQRKATRENARINYSTFLEDNGRPIFFFKTFDEVIAFFSKNTDKFDASGCAKEFLEGDYYVVFAHPKIGIAIYPNIALLIKHKENPYYKKSEAERMSLALLCGSIIKDKYLIEYLATNKLLPDARLESIQMRAVNCRKVVQENLLYIAKLFQK
ncbi:hypothetical protein BN938_1443 [Mucinivorans hirudinis]|uniref:DUF3843 family protein n=1 Tax=Mucinivorans hirudinis TaxID=1433126 RepID=A0A060R830_9BACT|nr:hypothetical protein BN938_1443 [Mucinivorans hirudinis]